MRKFLKPAIWINIIIGSVFSIAALAPSFANSIGLANSFKRVRGWPETKLMIVSTIQAGHEGKKFTAIATDNRLVFFDLLYYGVETDTGLPLRMWLNTNHIVHHAEATAPLTAAKGPVLIVNYFRDCEDESKSEYTACVDNVHRKGKLTYAEKFRQDFTRLEELAPLELDLGGGKVRKLRLWAGYNYTPTDKSKR